MRRRRAVQLRRRHWKRAGRSAWGWGSLTETEQKVTALVAQGLTNLQDLFLYGTKVTEGGAKKLKETLTKVKIDR